MSEPGETPKPAWLAREQNRLAPKTTEHGIKTGPFQKSPTYKEQVATRAVQQLAQTPASPEPLTSEHIASKQAVEAARQKQEQFKRTRSLKDIVEGR